MSRSQVHLSLPSDVDGALEVLAKRSSLSKSEVARQAIILLASVLSDPNSSEIAVRTAQIQVGVKTNG